MERKAPRCSADHWHELLVAMNKSDDDVVVSTTALQDVLVCHARKGGDRPSHDLLLKERGSKALVRRSRLWELVQDHGKICEREP